MAAPHPISMVKTEPKRMFVVGDVVHAKDDLSTGELALSGSGPYEVVGFESPFGGTEWLFLKRLPDGPRLEKSVHPSCLEPEVLRTETLHSSSTSRSS